MKELVTWCREERDRIQDRIERMEDGRAKFWHKSPDGQLIDTTADDLARDKTTLAELEALLARHPDL